MMRGSAWAIGWWDVLVAVTVIVVLAGRLVLTAPRARSNRAKVRARRRQVRALRRIQ